MYFSMMVRPLYQILALTLALWTSSTDAARILCVFPMPAPSHYFLGHKLMTALAARGHEVTMISPFKNKTPVKNYRDIVLEGFKEKMFAMMGAKEKTKLVDLGNQLQILQYLFTSFVGSGSTELALNYENVQDLLKSDEKFDLVIVEMFFTELLWGLAHKYDCPLLVLSTIGSSSWTNHLVGNPGPNSYVPDVFMQSSGHMNLYERLVNAVQNSLVHLHRRFFYYPRINEQLSRYFPDAPPLEHLLYNKTALILLNSHPSISDPRPLVPNMIEVGGFHIDEPRALPKDLQEFMDKATDGVVLFSMGSNLQSTDLDADTRGAILRAFAKLKQRVIWKWEDENLPGKPDNVKIMKWCPQNDIMAHPNLKLFITHGGLLSTTEAVYHGVPVIGVPIFGDQKMNVARTMRKGFGIGLNYEDLTEEALSAALHEVLNNPKYSQNAKLGSQLLRDRPVRPIDTAVYWTEYVIKHRGAAHLRTAAMDLQWCELYSVDLALLVIGLDVLLCLVFYYVIRRILRRTKKQTPMEDTTKSDAKKKRH